MPALPLLSVAPWASPPNDERDGNMLDPPYCMPSGIEKERGIKPDDSRGAGDAWAGDGEKVNRRPLGPCLGELSVALFSATPTWCTS